MKFKGISSDRYVVQLYLSLQVWGVTVIPCGSIAEVLLFSSYDISIVSGMFLKNTATLFPMLLMLLTIVGVVDSGFLFYCFIVYTIMFLMLGSVIDKDGRSVNVYAKVFGIIV